VVSLWLQVFAYCCSYANGDHGHVALNINFIMILVVIIVTLFMCILWSWWSSPSFSCDHHRVTLGWYQILSLDTNYIGLHVQVKSLVKVSHLQQWSVPFKVHIRMHLEIDLKYEDLNVTKINNFFPFPISCHDVINIYF
jgi:hypothetical protein